MADAEPSTTDRAEVDRRVLRRALRAGGVTATVLSVVLLLANAAFGGDGRAALIWVLGAVVLGTLVTAGWLVLTMLLDMLAGELPSRRRVVWTLVAFMVAFVSPVLPAAALLSAEG